MASRLSSLLVRDGLVGVKRMERAFQRQVIYGGALDTILLEMALIDEPTLCEYLSMATGLPAANEEQLEMISGEATEACPEELAREFYVAPLTIEDEALRVLVCEPVDFTQLEDLADRLDMAIQPLVTPEFRFNMLFSRAFGHPPNARFGKLAEAVNSIAPTTRTTDASGVPAAEYAAAPEPQARDRGPNPPREAGSGPKEVPHVMRPPEPAARDRGPNPPREAGSGPKEVPHVMRQPEYEPAPEARDRGPNPPREAGSGPKEVPHVMRPPEPEPEPETVVAENVDREIADVPLPATAPVRATRSFGSDTLAGTGAEPPGAKRVSDAYRIVRPLREPEPPRTGTLRDMSPPMPGGDPEPTPQTDRGEVREVVDTDETVPVAAGPTLSSLGVADARELLGSAANRDAIFEILLRALSTRARFAALMTHQGGTGLGRFALDNGARSNQAIDAAAIPLQIDSPFKQVIDGASPYIGRLAVGNPAVDEPATILCGGEMPPSALLLPIVLRDRVVAVALAHRAPDNIEVTELAELLPLAGDVGEALIRLIRDAKKRAATMSSATDGAAETRSAPSRSPGAHDAELELLLDRVDSRDRAISEDAKLQLIGRAAEVVPLLDDRFPGRLEVDRYEIGWRTIRASQYGPLLDLVIKLGAACGPMLATKLADPRRDLRYYAAVCAAELRPQATLEALVDRIFDRDYGVRDIALHALAGYPAVELDQALSSVRSALHSDLPERVVAAANAVAVLADLRSVPHLLEVLEGDRETAVPARRALRRLTCQDFAWSIRKWRSWWDQNRSRTRIEWLLDGLAHRDEELRRQAVDDLRSLTGESFDYNHDGTRREREDSRARWIEWWEQEGVHRFDPNRRDPQHRRAADLPELDR